MSPNENIIICFSNKKKNFLVCPDWHWLVSVQYIDTLLIAMQNIVKLGCVEKMKMRKWEDEWITVEYLSSVNCKNVQHILS